MKKTIIVLIGGLLWAAMGFGQYAINGTVVDELGQPLEGAGVVVLGVGEATVTDATGRFVLENLSGGRVQLEVRYVGRLSEVVNVEVPVVEGVRIVLRENPYLLDQVVVQATRAGDLMPFTYTNFDKEAIEKRNTGQDIPYLLLAAPSLVVTSDAGAGIGYTGLRIRGTDPTRINVTINGVPLNDAESQGVFWVDLPDLATSAGDIQVQRGVGTSTNGAGAFGATININTNQHHPHSYAEVLAGAGSFNTWRTTLSFGTGLIGNQRRTPYGPGWTVDGRLSKIVSDGYIDRASANLEAFFVSTAFVGKKSSLRANVFSGHEITYQAWNGVPAQWVNDERLRTFNISGTDYFQELENPHPNEVDDYRQTHYQLLFSQKINRNIFFNITGHYTHGAGFFEQYKIGENIIADYGLSVCDTCIADTDLIRRRWLDNDFWGGVWSLDYISENNKIKNTTGGAYNQYKGDHFGEIIWAEYMPGLRQNERYYFGRGDKSDFNIYNKTLFGLTSTLFGFIDMQFRGVRYHISGTDNDLRHTDKKLSWHFFNPKAGLTWKSGQNTSVYGSFAVARREPSRSDFTDAAPGAEPRPERLFNTELGVNFKNNKGTFSANFYHMDYKNQLALTGNINDVGGPVRINIPDSYRTGLELTGSIFFNKKTTVEANATFSKNKIKNFTEYIDNWDTGTQETVFHGTTDLAFSPQLIAFMGLNYALAKGLDISFYGKYTGRQFIDNTSNKNTILEPYAVGDLQIRYALYPKFAEAISFNLMVSNIFDKKYASNAWTYRYISNFYDGTADDPYTRSEGGGVYNLTGYYPQAGRHFMLALKMRF